MKEISSVCENKRFFYYPISILTLTLTKFFRINIIRGNVAREQEVSKGTMIVRKPKVTQKLNKLQSIFVKMNGLIEN
jgi:hypothetical protein